MNNEDKNENLIAHLEALRTTLIKCLYSFAIVLPFALFFAPRVLNYLIKIIIGNNNVVLNFFSPQEVFLIQIKTAVIMSLIVSFPYITKQLWNFLLPALYDNEKKFIKSIVLISTTLFILGVIFCLFLIIPFIIKFGMSFISSNVQAVFGISNVVNLALWLSIVFGIMFQLPLITFYLIKTEIISYEAMANKRPYVIVILLIMAGILTPPDIVSQIMLAIPSYFLFEGGLLFARLESGNKKDNID